jgi:RecA/RadA recombinase
MLNRRRNFNSEEREGSSPSSLLKKMQRQSEDLDKEMEKAITGKGNAFNRRSVVRFDKVVSTGSTLLDLVISGKRIRGGGLPGGIVVEIFGESSTGKTAMLEEIAASIQSRKGEIKYLDPEARLDSEYAELYGVDLTKQNYEKPKTVTEMFDHVRHPKFKSYDVINGILTDSLAALSTDMELSDDGDKRGQRRAKEFSEGFRKTAIGIEEKNILLVCSNQVREGEHGEYSPGGKAIPFYSSVRIKVAKPFIKGVATKIIDKVEVSGKTVEKVMGIRSVCEVIKSSLDDPWRKCIISIIFGYGIDSIRDDLQYLKDMKGLNNYPMIGREKGARSMSDAIKHIEENALRPKLRDEVIDLWEEIEKKFDDKLKRQKKERI